MDSKPHLRDAKTIRRVLMGEWAKNSSRLQALQALDNLEEQQETLRLKLNQAKAFIEHMGMDYRYAEWLAENSNPAKEPS